ncbi:hypothetical protein ACFCW6_01435 [Streptomyces sp. NPDC056333]|uniref:hypothetical protein n=1 Tax=Streptomyces sp. NPDC056333 TaxID=3345786 RepID=UPI0035D67CF8
MTLGGFTSGTVKPTRIESYGQAQSTFLAGPRDTRLAPGTAAQGGRTLGVGRGLNRPSPSFAAAASQQLAELAVRVG